MVVVHEATCVGAIRVHGVPIDRKRIGSTAIMAAGLVAKELVGRANA